MNIQAKIQVMSLKYKELKTCPFPVVKKMTIDELRKIAAEITWMMNQNQTPQNTKRRRQIEDVLKKCAEIQAEISVQASKDLGNGGRSKPIKDPKESELAKMAVHSVILHQIRSSQLKIKPQEYNEIYNLMKQMEQMVKEQGNNLQKVDEYLESAYNNVEQANEELKQAKQIQKHTRRMKFKLAVSGFFGALGYKILGLPGMIAGFFFGHKATG